MDNYIQGSILVIIFTVFIIGMISLSDWKHNENVQAYINENTCDELFILLADWNYGVIQEASYLKCMQDIFPNTENKEWTTGYYYPNAIDMQEYFLDQSCVELGVHILKKHFDYKKATELYNVKCSTPIEHLDLPEIIIERTEKESTETEETWIKSNESNYGKQYEDWK